MKTELVDRMNMAQLQRTYRAYTELAAMYEDVCGGPWKARAYREYYGIMDSRLKIYQRYTTLERINHGNGND